MSNHTEMELDLKDYLYYAFKEFSPKGGIWMKYLEHWDEAHDQLVKIVEEYFSEPPESKITFKSTDGKMLVLHCTQCHHEVEVGVYSRQKCDWCGGDMCIIGLGTDWSGVLTMQKADQEQVDEESLSIRVSEALNDYFGSSYRTRVQPSFAIVKSVVKAVKQLLTRQPMVEDVKNVIDNLLGLKQQLEAGEDWCSVAILEGATDLLQDHLILRTRQPVQVDEGILRCLQMARDTITTMEDNFNAGRPGFSCDVIDEIDKNIRLLTRQPIQVDEEEEQPPMDKETAGDMKYHALKDEGLLDKFGRRKQ